LLAVEVLSRRGKLIKPEPLNQVEPVKVTEPILLAQPVTLEPTPEPAAVEPLKAEPAAKWTTQPSRQPVPRSLTSADRVMSAHLAEPGATNQRIAELAVVSLATIKRHRPKRSASGSRSTDHAGQLSIIEPVAAWRQRRVARDLRDLVDDLTAEGWDYVLPKRRHPRLVAPSGHVVILPATPSDRRAWLNTKAQGRRIKRETTTDQERINQ
jgi:hypothetical protein